MNEKTYTQKVDKANYYQYTFNRSSEQSLPLFLDDLNVINIDNEETFDRVPFLEHHLEVIA